MKKIKKSFSLLGKNFISVAIFESSLKLLSFAIFSPMLMFVFNFVLKQRGYTYLTGENLVNFLIHPLVMIMIVLAVIINAIVTMIEVSALIFCFDASYHDIKVTALDMLLHGWLSSKKLLQRGNRFLIIFLLMLIPFSKILSLPNRMINIKIPVFVVQHIMSNDLFGTLYVIFFIIVALLVIRWLYSMHYFTLENISFKLSAKKSAKLIKGRTIRDVASFFICEGLVAFISLIVFLIFFIPFILTIEKVVEKQLWLNMAISILVTLLNFMQYCFIMPLSFSYLSVLFYYEKKLKNEQIQKPTLPKHKAEINKINKKSNIKTVFILLLSLIIINAIFSIFLTRGDYPRNISIENNIQVSAHRGDSLNAPENTSLAFSKAIDAGADYIELDVAQLKDGTIVVMHDSNFKRIANLAKNVWDITYDEVKNLDIGSWFSPIYSDIRISKLEDVLQMCKNKIKLNIEVKPTGKESNLEESVVKLIEQYDMINQCLVSSWNYKSLIKIKQFNEQIQTIYIMAILYGDISKLQYADAFSIEETAITLTLVKKIHGFGKEVHVWTLNSEEQINKMIEMNVDNIITDDPAYAKMLVKSATKDEPFFIYIDYINNLLEKLLGTDNFSISY